MDFAVNYWAVLASGIFAMVLGALWYGPLMGKQWMAAMGFRPEDGVKMGGDAKKSYVFATVGALLIAYVLALIFKWVGVYELQDGLMVAGLVWLGLIATQHLDTVLWEGKPWKLFGINVGYRLVSVMIMAVILTMWQ